ncbi:MAG: PhoD-like phosphatase N-terminal domain-containing protein [Gammaproteobacteria bacterium]|nr:PhoD-like phosphatase N-terminal domain-containing protein [Gammaproteobacteria bacterium]
MAHQRPRMSRRTALRLFGQGAAGTLALTGVPTLANSPGRATRVGRRPQVPSGLQVGDLQPGRALVWARSDRPGRMLVRWSTRESMAGAVQAPPVHVLADADFTGRIDLVDLPADQRVFVEVTFLDLDDYRTLSEPVRGTFLTPPASRRDLRFVWSGDTAGQGWASTPTSAACASTTPCAAAARTSSFTRATPSTRTARSRRVWRWRTAASGAI